jgi:hypothetical protein
LKGLLCAFLLVGPAAVVFPAPQPSWKSLPDVEPAGTRAHTGSFIVADPAGVRWKQPELRYDEKVATGRKRARVVVVVYNPVLEKEGGKTLIEHIGANGPVEYSHVLVSVIREASWGYIN